MTQNPYYDGFNDGRKEGLDKVAAIYEAARVQENHLYDQMAVDARRIDKLEAEVALLRHALKSAEEFVRNAYGPNVGLAEGDATMIEIRRALGEAT